MAKISCILRLSRRYLLALIGSGLLGGGLLPAQAADQPLPVPRFVSMRHGEVNLRVGPGTQYPVAWVFTRKDMPVEIIAEFETWRKIRDWDGSEGWVKPGALQGKRSVIIRGKTAVMLRRSADPGSDPVAQLETGVIGKLVECPASSPDWCRIEAADQRGWLLRTEFWGVYPKEIYPQ